MGVQNRTDLSAVPFIRSGESLVKESETVLQNLGRSGDMVRHTLMAQIGTGGAKGKWVPWDDETPSNGEQYPKGFLMATLSEAEIKAGDVVDVPILRANAIVDKKQIVIEGGKTLDTTINVPAGLNQTAEDVLAWSGLFVEDTVDIDGYEN